MPRKPRIYLPGVPSHVAAPCSCIRGIRASMHIVQRGNDRNVCFFETENYQFYLHCLEDVCSRYDVVAHAYVLMTNHVAVPAHPAPTALVHPCTSHLLMTPDTEEGISRVMQLVGNRYVQYINKKYRRTGTLWEGRHKSSLVDAEQYLLTCYRYIELNSVRANMVSHPGDYRWSSYRHHAAGEIDPIVTDHELYLRIDSNENKRQSSYRELFKIGLDEHDVHDIRQSAILSMPLGNDRFKAQIETAIGRPLGRNERGRPAKMSHEQDSVVEKSS